MSTSVSILLTTSNSQLAAVAQVLTRRLSERWNASAHIGADADATFTLELTIDASMKPDAFAIANRPGGVRLTGASPRALLFAGGRVLRDATVQNDRVQLGAWRGTSVPACPLRGMYLASHMNNFYEDGPVDEVLRYVEDLALWGYNTFMFHVQRGTEDPGQPELHRGLERFRTVYRRCKELGLEIGLLVDANVRNASTPPGLDNSPFPDDLKKRGNACEKICPSIPAAREWLLSSWTKLLDSFADTPLDYVATWPYDAGGCGCEKCWPWGYGGYLRISRDTFRIAKQKFPGCKSVFSAWMFDMPAAGEWEGLARELAKDRHEIDFILADDDEDFPRHPLEKGVPGGLPLINFPEITMWGMWPWGSYGMNPLPRRFQRLWNQVKGRVAGGFPYSEGIWDDMNKAIVAGFYWDANATADATLRAYIRSEFGLTGDAINDVMSAIDVLERAMETRWAGDGPKPDALDFLTRVEPHLNETTRRSWRWRILHIRAKLDRERYAQPTHRFLGDHWPTPACTPWLSELIAIYHAGHAANAVRPPLKQKAIDAGAIPAPNTALRA